MTDIEDLRVAPIARGEGPRDTVLPYTDLGYNQAFYVCNPGS